MPIDLHNFYLFALLAVPLILIRATSGHGPLFGMLCSIVLFLVLGGRVLTHGLDLRQSGSDNWRMYVFVNLAFDSVCALAVLVLYWV